MTSCVAVCCEPRYIGEGGVEGLICEVIEGNFRRGKNDKSLCSLPTHTCQPRLPLNMALE